MRIRNSLNFVLCLIFIYSYIYAPPFRVIPFGLDKLVVLFSYMYITYKKEWGNLFRKFKIEFIWLTILSIMSLMILILFQRDKTLASYDFLLLIEVLPCSYAMYLLWEKNKHIHLDKVLLYCSIIAALISTYLLINPEEAYILKKDILKFPEEVIKKFIHRGYGLSDGLFYAYPVVQGFCLSLMLMTRSINKLYLFFILPLIFSIFSNARSGLVPVFISLCLLLLFIFKAKVNFLSIFKFTFSFIIGAFLLVYLARVLLGDNEMLNAAFKWGMSTFEIVDDFVAGKEVENVNTLLDDMVVWPNSLDEWLIGSGFYIFSDAFRTTDVGYFLRLNYGGIVYFSFWLFFIIYLFRRLYFVNKKVALLLFISLIYLNYKSDFFLVNPASRFFFLVYVLCILDYRNFSDIKVLCV